MVELHQNSALQPGDVVTAGPIQVGNFTGTSQSYQRRRWWNDI